MTSTTTMNTVGMPIAIPSDARAFELPSGSICPTAMSNPKKTKAPKSTAAVRFTGVEDISTSLTHWARLFACDLILF